VDYKNKPELDENLLVHFGVKGMKWGERRAARQHQRSLNRASRQKDRQERNDSIDAARARYASGAIARDYKAAKVEYKAQKHVIGRREAKKILHAKRDALQSEYERSQEIKSGRETTATILGAIGGVAIGTAATAALATRNL
jgi:hypothetical protein